MFGVSLKLNCLLQNIKAWTEAKFEADVSSRLLSDIHQLMRKDSIDEYNSQFETLVPSWPVEFAKYFNNHINEDLIKCGKWVLEPLNLYCEETGVG